MQEILSILCNHEVYSRDHKSPLLVPVLGQMNVVYTLPTCILKTYFHIALPLTLRFPLSVLRSGFLTKTL